MVTGRPPESPVVPAQPRAGVLGVHRHQDWPSGRGLQPGTQGPASALGAPLTHGGGGAVSGGDCLGPAGGSLQTRRGRHGVSGQARAAHSAPGGGRTPGRSRGAASGAGAAEPAAGGGETRFRQASPRPAGAGGEERCVRGPRVRGARGPARSDRRSAEGARPRGGEPRANVFIRRVLPGLTQRDCFPRRSREFRKSEAIKSAETY